MIKNLVSIAFLMQGCYGNEMYYYKKDSKIKLEKNYDNITRTNSNMDYYTNEQGVKLAVTNKILVKLKENTNIENILAKYQLSFEKKLGKNLYLLSTQNKSQTLKKANALHEDKNIEYAHPDFIKKTVGR